MTLGGATADAAAGRPARNAPCSAWYVSASASQYVRDARSTSSASIPDRPADPSSVHTAPIVGSGVSGSSHSSGRGGFEITCGILSGRYGPAASQT